MLLRLHVKGFKSLVDTEVKFGPFTCIAGPNGSGKSNLFDAISFLRALTDKSLWDAALAIRNHEGRSSHAYHVRSLFSRNGNTIAERMDFEADMIVPSKGEDDSGQPAEASSVYLRYRLGIKRGDNLETGGLHIDFESLESCKIPIEFGCDSAWIDSIPINSFFKKYISTEENLIIRHTDVTDSKDGGGQPRKHLTERLVRTVLSTADAFEGRTVLMAKREIQSWKMLQLEPSALRSPDEWSGPQRMDERGSHLPALLARLAGLKPGKISEVDTEKTYSRVSSRLKSLLEDVRKIEVDIDDKRELLSIIVTDKHGTKHYARDLSDGTLRFLALTLLVFDPESPRLICLEEPENGIHPKRIQEMIRLLMDLTVNTHEAVDMDNPLRQMIINTHSPEVAANVPDDALLIAMTEMVGGPGQWQNNTQFKGLSDTWRVPKHQEREAVGRNTLYEQLALWNSPQTSEGTRSVRDRKDVEERRKEVQLSLFKGE